MVFGDSLLQKAQLGLHGEQFGQRRAHLREEGPSTVLQAVLGEIAESGAPGDLNLPAVRAHLPCQHPEQGGLPRPVLSAQADAVAEANVPVDAGKQAASAEILDDVPELQHGACYNTERGRGESG